MSPEAEPHPKRYLTVPNALSLGRLIATPYVAKKLAENPKKWWKPATAIAATDFIDGLIARRFDQKSEFGRKLDPVADKTYGASILIAEARAGVMPKWLAVTVLAQKVLTASAGIRGELNGRNLQVSQLGRVGEFVGGTALYGLAAAESIDDPKKQQLARGVAIGLAIVGLAASTTASVRYHIELSKLETPPGQRSGFTQG